MNIKWVLRILILATGINAYATKIYVSPEGNDKNPGTELEPLASLIGARNKVRHFLKEGIKEDVLVLFKGGTYLFRETVVFNLEDSAPEGFTITYSAMPDEKPIFSSALSINGWEKLNEYPDALPEKAKGNVWVTSLPNDVGLFYSMFDGEDMLQRARSRGYYPTTKKMLPTERWKDLHTLKFPDGALKNWDNLGDVEIYIRPNNPWLVNYLDLESVDLETNTAKTRLPGTYALNRTKGTKLTDDLKDEGCFWVDNVLESLDSPGEWVVNTKTRKIYLWPKKDVPGDKIVIPTLRTFIRVEGTNVEAIEGDVPITGLIFKDIVFTCGERDVWTLEDKGLQHDWEMWDKDNAMLRFCSAENCIVTGCEFRNSGSGGVRLDRYAQNISINNNHIYNLGCTGILLAGYGPGKKDVNKNNEITNNYIHHIGLLIWHNAGIMIWQSGSNRITNNHIHHTPYNAIVLSGVRPHFHGIPTNKWKHRDMYAKDIRENMRTIRWDEIKDAKEPLDVLEFAHTRNNLVQDNELHHAVTILNDGNVIYISATGKGNVIKRNLMYHSRRSNSEFRFDDDQHYTLLIDNIIIGNSVMLKFDNYIENNILLCNYIKLVGSAKHGARVERNIIYAFDKKAKFYNGTGVLPKIKLNNNIYYNYNVEAGRLAFEEFKEYDSTGSYADPLFINLDNLELGYKEGSPAYSMGINPIETDKIGLKNDPAFPRLRREGGLKFLESSIPGLSEPIDH